jgi:PleD family two-component response regulator
MGRSEIVMSDRSLLLIEDDYDVAEMLMMYFRSCGYRVLHASDGEEGIHMARTHFPNLILLDVMLPDMDGYDVCLSLRRAVMTKFIPILFLTQRDERVSKVRGLELGADDYITKPFDIDELRVRIQGIIDRATRENLHEARTGLPTGKMITEEMSRKRNAGENFSTLIYSINGFTDYCDVYGFMAANHVIDHTGRIIHEVLGELGTQDDFVGISENDFVMMTHMMDLDGMNDVIVAKFDEEVQTFYSFTDAEQGGVVLGPGTDDERLIPMMTLSCKKQSLANAG